MLHSFFFSKNFLTFNHSGWYIDFFLKKLSEVFVRNVFIYTSLFFAEKYLIEKFTKKIIDFFIINFNRWFNFTKFTYVNFFFNFISILFYSITLYNLYYIYLI